MKIIIENNVIPYDLGCKLLKLKGGNSPFEELSDIWDNIIPLTFSEIAQIENIEHRRMAINYFGMDKLIKEVKPKLINQKTLKKKSTWINKNGIEETINFIDTYELYEVSGEKLFAGAKNNWNTRTESVYYVKCKDTSTDREYLIWVDIWSVMKTNGKSTWNTKIENVSPIECIAWTITTNVAEGNIEKIVRQGDCIMIKPKEMVFEDRERHLTEKEYKQLLVLES
jgi:hypothetical protein